jgi:hypothetical protein
MENPDELVQVNVYMSARMAKASKIAATLEGISRSAMVREVLSQRVTQTMEKSDRGDENNE